MNIVKFSFILLFAATVAQAQDSGQRAAVKRAEAEAATATAEPAKAQVRAIQAQPASPGKSASDQISAKPGTVLSLCCGSVDPHEMTGSNCAYMHTGQGCAGFILACPEGSKDTVKKDGTGYCKEGG